MFHSWLHALRGLRHSALGQGNIWLSIRTAQNTCARARDAVYIGSAEIADGSARELARRGGLQRQLRPGGCLCESLNPRSVP